jgi:hypothetical protein
MKKIQFAIFIINLFTQKSGVYQKSAIIIEKEFLILFKVLKTAINGRLVWNKQFN